MYGYDVIVGILCISIHNAVKFKYDHLENSRIVR